jgi:hypothetical protein
MRSRPIYKPKYILQSRSATTSYKWDDALLQAPCSGVRKNGLVNTFGYFRH